MTERCSDTTIDAVSQAMTTAGMNPNSRRSSLLEIAGIRAAESAYISSQKRPSLLLMEGHHLAANPIKNSIGSRRSSKASAIFLVSPSNNKEIQPVPEPEDGSPRRRTISIIATVGAFLLVLSILLVTITLRLATHIDDLGSLYFYFYLLLVLPPC